MRSFFWGISVCLDVTERLVGTVLLVGVGHGIFTTVSSGSRVRGVVGAIRLSTSGTNGLIGVRGLLGSDAASASVLVAVRRATRAAADAESPEDGADQGEGDG